MKGFLTGFTKFVLGVSLAMMLLSLAGVATARYFMARLSYLPPRPVFDNDIVNVVNEQTNTEEPTTPPTISTEVALTQQDSLTSASQAEPATVLEKPPGSYEAVVIQPIGLVLRAGPGSEYGRIGGVDYNDQILVLKTSEDGRWLNVRVGESGQEGWIKAGNTQSLIE